MIKYEWRTELSLSEATELAGLLARAEAYDAEPGYNTIDFTDVERSLADGSSARHLLIWMLPHATAMDEPPAPECIAGLLRLTDGTAGSAEATVVIEPRLRSIGIMTLFLEQVGLDTAGQGGWLGTGLHTITSWARGNHPASGRLSNRFLIPRTRRVWQLIRGTESEVDLVAVPVLEPSGSTGSGRRFALRESGRLIGSVMMRRQPVLSEEFGECAVVSAIEAAPSAPPEALRRLLDGVVAIAADAGLSGAIVNVDSDDTRLVNAARLTGFHHDRTDVRYELGGSS